MSADTPNDFEIHHLLKKRRSPRAFADRLIPTDTLRGLLEAVRWAPSSYNEQPWVILVATRDDAARFEQMLGCLVPGNQSWAKAAPALMISVAKLQFERNGKTNRHAFHDVGLAISQLTLQATASDLFVHQMAGFDVEMARSTYAIPAAWEPVAAIAIGYRGDADRLPEELRARETAPRARKPQREFAFTGRWGEPF